jgi:hypothetical protein
MCEKVSMEEKLLVWATYSLLKAREADFTRSGFKLASALPLLPLDSPDQ